MNDLVTLLQDWFTEERVYLLVRVSLLLAGGYLLARIARTVVGRVLAARSSPHVVQLGRRAIFYGVLAMFGVSVLREFGFNLTVLLGAAGILTVAIGFASQTSMSNLISGLFLISERPFVVSDFIRVADITGEVISIDLLSLKLRTFDNLLVRIPNETMIKSEVVNLTHFPIRRVNVDLGVAYKEDLRKVQRVLLEVAERNPLCLEEPEPLYLVKEFGTSSMNLLFGVWTAQKNYLDLMNSIKTEIKEAFDREGIEIPFPHVTLYTGAVTEPFPLSMTERSKPAAESTESTESV